MTRAAEWDEVHDLVVIGSGAGAVVAALVAKQLGLSAVILEKQALFGGTTALSGGVMWIPCNPIIGDGDDPATARAYMDAVIGPPSPGSTAARRDAYVREAPRMVDFLMRSGLPFASARVPDYYHGHHPGAVLHGRSILPDMFDTRRIGAWADRLGSSWRTPSLPVRSHEIAAMLVARRSWAGRLATARVGGRVLVEKLTGRTLRGGGRALQGRLLELALREALPIAMETAVRDLVVVGARVAGVVAQRDGRIVRIAARRAVLINAGGFAHDGAMRQAHLPQPTSADWSSANPGDTGECIRMAMAAGAATAQMDQAWWVPTSMPVDASKPHFMVVDKTGTRFCNEAQSYVASGRRLYEHGAIPAFGIFDRSFRAKYTFVSLMLHPGRSEQAHLDSGALVKADTLADLARQLGIDPAGLERGAARFNRFAATGKDEDFGKGDFAYNRHFADPTHRPNPCLGAIARPPFYAIRIWPADIGTSGGLLTDEHARVLRADGSAIAGLYATGNSSASVMGGAYPGAGSTIGPSLTFAYIAARHIAARA